MTGAGTFTFLFTDIESSTRMLQELRDRYEAVLHRYRRLVREAVALEGGEEIGTEGDSFFVVFETAGAGVRAALAAQLALGRHPWPDDTRLRVRMGLHTGEAHRLSGGFVGLAVHRAARIAGAAHGGQVLASRATTDLLEDVPAEGVRLEPLGPHHLKDFDSPEELFQVSHPDLEADFPPPRTEVVSPTNLPVQLTSFIGREQELSTVRKLLGEARLVTLTGAGGAGKTRLAQEVASSVFDEFPDGVWWVDLAPISDADLVPREAALAVGLQEGSVTGSGPGPGSSLDRLTDHLRRRRALLVLDNCEHLLEACAELTEVLLRSCPEVRVAATSREPLGVPGETTRRVPSLSLPAKGSAPEDAAGSESVRLFCERALAVRGDVRLDEEELVAVAQICRRLDGIPLAIELAAARARSLSCVQISERLDDRFRLLTGGSRTAMPRQRTLEALVDWSHNLLSDPERVLLRRLSIFAGGFSLESAEAICSEEGVDELDVVDLLGFLVDKSLVVADIEGPRNRYRLLETIRQYGREKLLAAGEVERWRTRHLRRFADLAEAEGRFVLEGPEQLRLLDQFEAEHDNLRSALEWALSVPELVHESLRLAAGITWFWWIRGHLDEGRTWLHRVVEGSEGARTPDRIQCLASAAFMDVNTGRVDARSMALAEEALSLLEDLRGTEGISSAETVALFMRGILGEVAGEEDASSWSHKAVEAARADGRSIFEAAALQSLGIHARSRGRPDEARRHYEEGLAICREIDARTGMARLLSAMAVLDVEEGDLAPARAMWEETLSISRDLGDKIGIRASLQGLSAVARASGAHAEARALGEELVVFARAWGNPTTVVTALNVLGYAHLHSEEWETARALLEEALEVSRAMGDSIYPANALHSLGELEEARGDVPAARRLFEASLEVVDRSTDQSLRSSGLVSLGHVLRRQGELERARGLLSEALGLQRQEEARAIEGLAHLAAEAGAWDVAARLLGAALSARNPLGYRSGVYDEEFEGALARGREALGPRFDELYEEGRRMPVDEAVEAARTWAGAPT